MVKSLFRILTCCRVLRKYITVTSLDTWKCDLRRSFLKLIKIQWQHRPWRTSSSHLYVYIVTCVDSDCDLTINSIFWCHIWWYLLWWFNLCVMNYVSVAWNTCNICKSYSIFLCVCVCVWWLFGVKGCGHSMLEMKCWWVILTPGIIQGACMICYTTSSLWVLSACWLWVLFGHWTSGLQ